VQNTDNTAQLEKLARLLGERFKVDVERGRISGRGGETVADYDQDRGRLWSYITVYAYGAADMSDEDIVELADDAIERDGDDMHAMGWEIVSGAASVDSGSDDDQDDTRYLSYEVEHHAPSVDVVATLLLGEVAPPFEFET
jgi:hypothetical protein